LLGDDIVSDENYSENLVRPWAVGRKAWLFASSELDGQREGTDSFQLGIGKSQNMHFH